MLDWCYESFMSTIHVYSVAAMLRLQSSCVYMYIVHIFGCRFSCSVPLIHVWMNELYCLQLYWIFDLSRLDRFDLGSSAHKSCFQEGRKKKQKKYLYSDMKTYFFFLFLPSCFCYFILHLAFFVSAGRLLILLLLLRGGTILLGGSIDSTFFLA